MNMDWKRMGFNNEEEYTKFLDQKLKEFVKRLESNGKVLSVFKRLKDR